MERDQAKRKKRKSSNSSQKKRPPEVRKKSTNKSTNRIEERKSSNSRNKSKNKAQKNRAALDTRSRQNNSTSNRNPRRKQVQKKPPSVFDEKIKPMIRSVLNIMFYVFIIVIVFTAIMFTFNDDQTKSFFGYRIMTVKTDSMAPKKDTTYKDGFKAGALIILKKEDKNNLKVGDIITYMPTLGRESAFLTHRIVEILDELEGVPGKYYVTQGDANDVSDAPFTPDHYMGTVIYSVPNLGIIIQFIQNNIFVVLLLALAVFCFYVTLRYYLSMPN